MRKDTVAAGRYTQALFELAKPIGKEATLEAELGALSAGLKADPQLERFLLSPHVPLEAKEKALGRLYGKDGSEGYEVLLKFLTLLLQKKRFDLIHDIAAGFKRTADEARGEMTARVTTAIPLDQKKEAALQTKLDGIVGLKVSFSKEIDPSILGGVVVSLRHRVLDGSVRGSLRRLKNELVKVRVI